MKMPAPECAERPRNSAHWITPTTRNPAMTAAMPPAKLRYVTGYIAVEDVVGCPITTCVYQTPTSLIGLPSQSRRGMTL
jgi:hypothetical protein